MTQLTYLLMDVFTQRPFTGNQLAVVPFPPPDLTTTDMQDIAREFNLAETVFIAKPADAEHTADLRIFTATAELPFAGHPTLGAAIALGILAKRQQFHLPDPALLRFKEPIGTIPVHLTMAAADHGHAVLETAQLPVRQFLPLSTIEMAEMLGVETDALSNAPRWNPEIYSCGVPFLCVPLRSRADVDRVSVNGAQFRSQIPIAANGRTPYLYVFSCDQQDPTKLYSRMFTVDLSIVEDSATGSAAAAVGGYLFDRAPVASGSQRWSIEQGVAMERPSTLEIEVQSRAGAICSVRVGGHAVLMGEGTLRRPGPQRAS